MSPQSTATNRPRRSLGRSDLTVSALGLGCWAIGGPWTFVDHPAGWGPVDDAESIRAIHFALDQGINFFDTAANYGCGHSERVLGRALAGRRHDAAVATKFGYNVDEAARLVTRRPDAEIVSSVRADCEAGLRRLNMGVIDLYQLHAACFPFERVDDLIAALEELVVQGKIRWYGWSTDDPERARALARGPHCATVQHMLNVANDAPEMLRICEEENLASIARTPLCGGLLAGKITRATRFPPDDIRSMWCLQEGWAAERLRQAAAARPLFTSGGRTMAQGALAWILARSSRALPIPGFKTLAHVRENAGALDFGPMAPHDVRRLDSLFGRQTPPPPPRRKALRTYAAPASP